ncbi:glycosyl hydrolase [Flagelloscypha sp. PMI_526]|nr:glycosyl hydrolase [Flagelloscypha sp. PMI_526]
MLCTLALLFTLHLIQLEANPLLNKRSVSGPKLSLNFPDPSLIWAPEANLWYAYGTNGNGHRVQVATSPDFNTWTISTKEALPTVGAWVYAASPNVWAPMVLQLNDGSYVMYYSATSAADTTAHCVSVATASTAAGPFVPRAESFACHLDQGGAIDAAGHHHPDGVTKYVVYKVDGNNRGHGGSCNNGVAPIQSTPIMLQQVAANGYDKIGSPIQILDRDDGDGPLVEAPVRSTPLLFLPPSDVSYATATSVAGPYTKSRAPYAPLLVTGTDGLKAPGSICVAKDGSKAVFHAFLGADINSGRGTVPVWTSHLDALSARASNPFDRRVPKIITRGAKPLRGHNCKERVMRTTSASEEFQVLLGKSKRFVTVNIIVYQLLDQEPGEIHENPS